MMAIPSCVELRLKELEFEKYKFDKEIERKERQFQLRLVNAESFSQTFDVTKVVKFVPLFNEVSHKNSSFYSNMSQSLDWPKKCWPLLVQSVLKDKGKSMYLSLTSAE